MNNIKLKGEILHSLKNTLKNKKFKLENKIKAIKFVENNKYEFDFSSLAFIKAYLTGDQIVVDDKYLLIKSNKSLFLYSHKKDFIKLEKTINCSYLIYKFDLLTKNTKTFLLKIFLKVIKFFKSEAYVEAIMFYLDVENIVNLKEYQNGLEIYYNNGTIKIYDSYLNEIQFNNLIIKKNELEFYNFKLIIKTNNIKIKRKDTNFVDIRKIKDIKSYYIFKNKIYLLAKKHLIIGKFI